jgi:hypothetical protein
MRGNLRPNIIAKPLEFGTAYHAAMAVYYEPLTWHLLKNPDTAGIVHVAATAEFLRECSRQQKSHPNMDIEIEQDYEERRKLGVGMLNHYFQWAPTVDRFTPVRVEVEFEVPIALRLGDDDIVYQGRLDGIVQDEQGWYWILEHKTAGQFANMEHLPLDEQLTSYGWAMQHQLGIQIKGAIYSEALKDIPEPPKMLVNQREGRWYSVNKTQRTTYELCLQTLLAAGEPIHRYQEFLDYLRAEPNRFFRRFEQYRTAREYEEIGQRIAWEAQDMINPDLALYPNPGRFNCSYCAFKEPCLTMNQGYDYQFILNELFTKREETKIDEPTEEIENGIGSI